jgi:hypothetical protein
MRRNNIENKSVASGVGTQRCGAVWGVAVAGWQLCQSKEEIGAVRMVLNS